jgi:hypothetical protein
LPSADSIGRIVSCIESETLRERQRELYRRFRRKKVLQQPEHGLVALILDGHESSASYRRRCRGCLQRRIQTVGGERIQYYHRNVTAMLRAGSRCFLLDVESQRPGEDEVAAALRLYARVLKAYPRAFDVVVVDGLYAGAPFFRRVIDSGKHVIAVLKNDERELVKDARGLFASLVPVEERDGRVQRLLWDAEGFASWPQLGREIRVVRSLERFSIRRQIDGHVDQQQSDWIWASTLSMQEASTRTVVDLGHGRWGIENEGFNELVSDWHADHLFRHHPKAIVNFLLLAFHAYNLFHAFVDRNLKRPFRERFSRLHWARLMMCELYDGVWNHPLSLPP